MWKTIYHTEEKEWDGQGRLGTKNEFFFQLPGGKIALFRIQEFTSKMSLHKILGLSDR